MDLPEFNCPLLGRIGAFFSISRLHPPVLAKADKPPPLPVAEAAIAACEIPVEPAMPNFKCIESAYQRSDLDAIADPGPMAASILVRAEEVAGWIEHCLDGGESWGFAFDAACACPEIMVVREENQIPPNLWFIGDVHGDILALETALGYIDGIAKRESLPPPTLVFLGDLFDRGRYGYEVALRVLALAKDRPGQVLWLAGNHDVAFQFSEATDRFNSGVDPAELVDWMNETTDPIARRIGKGLARLGKKLPVALFLPDGLLAAHGGVPHTDLQKDIVSTETLNGEPYLQDFVWTRLHPRARQRMPNRNSKTCDLGILDFEAFCMCASAVLSQPVSRMVRGHDHVAEKRFDFYSNYRRNPVLTINTMSCRGDGEWGEQFATTPCVARYRKDCLPEVHRLTIPEEVVKRYHAADETPQATDEPTA